MTRSNWSQEQKIKWIKTKLTYSLIYIPIWGCALRVITKYTHSDITVSFTEICWHNSNLEVILLTVVRNVLPHFRISNLFWIFFFLFYNFLDFITLSQRDRIFCNWKSLKIFELFILYLLIHFLPKRKWLRRTKLPTTRTQSLLYKNDMNFSTIGQCIWFCANFFKLLLPTLNIQLFANSLPLTSFRTL